MWDVLATTQTIYVSVVVQKPHAYVGTEEINTLLQQPLGVCAHRADVAD
jgi:hypothetical protein